LRKLPKKTIQFLEDATGFMRRWQLSQFTTWDLPLIDGVLENVPLGLARAVRGPDQPVTVYPSYYNVPTSVDIRAKIREQQEGAARRAGLPMDHPIGIIIARGETVSSYENALRLWVIESSVIRRYGRSRGLADRLIPTFAELLGDPERSEKEIPSESNIARIRRIYAPSLCD
jgi:hypothetical protein